MYFIKGSKRDSQAACTPRPQTAGNNQIPPNQYPTPNGGPRVGSIGAINAIGNGGQPVKASCVMVQQPGNGMGRAPCPFTSCLFDQAMMGQYGQPNGDPYGRPPMSAPCQECGTTPNAPCVQMQNGGMMPNEARPPMSAPCLECGTIPNAPCVQRQNRGMMGMGMGPGMGMGMGPGIGMGMNGGGAMPPCIECGSIPNAPCLPPQYGQQGGFSCSNGKTPNTPCVECAGLENPPCAEPSEGNYQEIGASMGGNTLTIRVHKDKNKIEAVDPNGSVVSDNNSEMGCCCSPCSGTKKKKQEHNLNMRPGIQQGNQDMPFAFKMGKSGNPGGNNVIVNPPVATGPDGTKFTEFSDPNKELFILRVGKKSEGIDKKQNLELELCTPRGKAL